MKKWLIGGIVTGMLAVGGIGAVWAAETPPRPASPAAPSFEQMLPYMEQMHPGLDKETLQTMYNACHTGGGMMWGNGAANGAGFQSMMRGL